MKLGQWVNNRRNEQDNGGNPTASQSAFNTQTKNSKQEKYQSMYQPKNVETDRQNTYHSMYQPKEGTAFSPPKTQGQIEQNLKQPIPQKTELTQIESGQSKAMQSHPMVSAYTMQSNSAYQEQIHSRTKPPKGNHSNGRIDVGKDNSQSGKHFLIVNDSQIANNIGKDDVIEQPQIDGEYKKKGSIFKKQPDKIPMLKKRRLLIQPFGFRKRLFIFFICFMILFTIYISSFIGHTDIGIFMEDTSKALLSAIFTPIISFLKGIIPSVTVGAILDGLLKFLTADFVDVVIMTTIASIVISAVISFVIMIYRTKKLMVAAQPTVHLETLE